MEEIEQIRKDILEIKGRNKRVEIEKAWETSWFRKVVVAVLTYIVIVLFFLVAGLQKPFLNALVPTLGFILSTISVSYFKKVWIQNLK